MNTIDYSAFRSLDIRAQAGIHFVILNRPERLNAIDAGMAQDLSDYFGALQSDQSVRVVVLKGAGRHFCAGLDLNEVDAFSSGTAANLRLQRSFSEIVMRMRRCPQPIVALIHGAASGGGFAIALAADVRYAAVDARMNVAMARIGLSGCDMGISYFLPRAVGTSNAAELMMGGRFVDAQKALRIGLVSEVAPRDQLDGLAASLAAEMLAMSPVGLRLTKEGLNAAQDAGSLEAVIAAEDRGQVLCIGPYMKEGVAAFREKRPPNYGEA